MRGGYLYDGGMFWFDAGGRLVCWERGVTLARWSRAGDALTIIRGDESTRWTVFSEAEDHATIVADGEAVLLTRFQPSWSADDTRAALRRSWRQVFAPDGEYVYFRPWAPTLELAERVDTISVECDGALIRVGDEAMLVFALANRLLTLYEHEAHVWAESTALPEDEHEALRRALLGSWRLFLPAKALAHVHFQFTEDRVTYAIPNGTQSAPWRLEPDGHHVVVDGRLALLLLGPPDELCLALPETLLRAGTVLVRDDDPDPTAWEGDWVIRRSGSLEREVAEAFMLPLRPPLAAAREPGHDLRALMWSVSHRARPLELRETSPDGRLVFADRAWWRWVETGDDTRLLMAADSSVIELGRAPASPPDAHELVGTWRVMAWPGVFLDGHALVPSPTLILADDRTFTLSAFDELAGASGSWSWDDGALVLEQTIRVDVTAVGRYAWRGTDEDGHEVLVVRTST